MVHHHRSIRHSKLLELLGISENNKDAIHVKQPSYWNALYVLLVLGLSVAPSLTITLIPMRNYFESEPHLYELALDQLRNTLVIVPLLVITVILDCYFCFNLTSVVCIQSFLRLLVPVTLTNVFLHCLLSQIWNVGLGYNLPVPFIALLWFPISGLLLLSIWFEFPYKLRKNKIYRRRFIFYITGFELISCIIFQYDALSIMIPMLPTDFQWSLAFVLPLLRASNLWMVDKCMSQTVQCNSKSAKFGLITFIRSLNTIYVAIILANITETTLYSISGMEFLLQFHLCYKIITLHRQTKPDGIDNGERKEKIKECVVELVVGETIEVLASVAYSITLAAAYYGPNATILGNIRNSYWTYDEIKDIHKSLILILKITALDLGMAIFCGGILWIFCRINLFQEFCAMIKTNWFVISLRISVIMSRVG